MLSTIVGILALVSLAQGQPTISYIIPDIGAEGINSYVEIIGPHDKPSNFGPDGVYANILGDAVRVVPAAADADKIVVGPLVVSWDGRMISTQVFVKPGTTYRGPIGLTVTVNGQSITDRSFSIVTPQSLGTAGVLSRGGVLGSGGEFGTRSKRGAMIVDSLILASGTFTISTQDPDGDLSNGNQGYLPFILISRGRIVVDGSTVLNVNAGVPNAGAGGGGGGGSVCDGSAGNDGGAGYTAGGAGGQRGNGFAATGVSSGINGGSLNGVASAGDGRPNCQDPSASGGGTGHPFGTGGSGFCSGIVLAGSGGGAGNAPGAGGGGGGFATDGKDGGSSTFISGGRAYGNIQGVPVAGGSGGGGGNTIVLGACGGSGGGGGGAIALYSMDALYNRFRINAAGGDGGSGSGAGGGSGGYVAVGSKITGSTAGSLVALGGSGSGIGGAGGAGRVRFDGFAGGDPTVSSGTSSYAGPEIDTLGYSDSRVVSVTGTGNGADSIRLYFRGDNSEWTLAPPVTLVPGTRRWSCDVTLPSVAGRYYVVAMQRVRTTGVGSPSSREPAWVLSQTAANIVTLQVIPKINVADSLRFSDVLCQGEALDSLVVSNAGDAPLTVTPSISGSPNFWLLPPYNALFSIAPRSSVYIGFRFTPPSVGLDSATLLLSSDDPRVVAGLPQSDRTVQLFGRRLLVEQQFIPGEVDFGDVCIGATIDTIIALHYRGDVAGEIVSADGLDVPVALIEPASATLPRSAGLVASVQVRLRFHSDTAGTFVDTLRVRLQPCDTILLLPIRGRAISPKVAITPATLAFGDVSVGGMQRLQLRISNVDDVPVTITNAWFDPTNSELTIDPSIVGRTMLKDEEIVVDAIWRPSAIGPLRPTRFCITLGGVCQVQRCIDVNGRGVRSRLQLSQDRLVMTADSCLDDPIEDLSASFTLRNNGTAPERVTGFSTTAAGVIVTASPRPAPDFELGPGETVLFNVVWTPSIHGVITDRIVITTGTSESGGDPVSLPLELRRNVSVLGLLDTNGLAISDEVEFSPDFSCMGPQLRSFLVGNLGTLDESVNLRFLNRAAFGIRPTSTYAIGRNAAPVPVSIVFDPGAPGEYFDTLVVTSNYCSRELRIPFHGTRYQLAFSVDAVTFAPSKIGITSSRTASFSNTSTGPNNARIVISSAYIKQTGGEFAVVGSTLPASVAPGEVATVDLSFTPASQGNYTAELCYVIDAPCPQEVCVRLSGSGNTASLIVRSQTMNFGPRLICQDSTLELVVENTGNALRQIQNIRLGGVDSVAFQQASSLSYPYPLSPGESIRIPFRFIPSRALHDGLNVATITVVPEDPIDGNIVVDLMGERRRGILPTPTRLDFGRVELTTSAEKSVVFSNRTDRVITIDRLTIDPPFTLVAPVTPLTIPARDSLLVRVRIEPTDTSALAGVLVVHQSAPCDDSTVVNLSARGGVAANGVAAIALSRRATGRPGDKISIPILLESAKDLSAVQGRTLHGRVRVARRALLLNGARARWEFDPGAPAPSGTLPTTYSVTTDATYRVIEFDMDSPTVPALGDTLGVIDAVVLLGDSVTARLMLDTIYWVDGKIRMTRRNGLFTLDGYCTVGGDRLVAVDAGFGIKMAVPNPFNPSTDIVFETITDDPVSLTIVDARGNLVATIINNELLAVQVHQRRWDAAGFPSGLYYAVLTTPRRRSIQPLLLVK